MKRLVLFFALIILVISSLKAQEDGHEHKHIHPEFELGFSNNLVFNFTEEEFVYGIHLHFVKTIGKSDKIGLGIAYEKIFDEHKHNSLSLIFMCRPVEHLSFNMAPGISWLASETNTIMPVMHIEGLYEWEFGFFHIGPLIGVAFSSEDFHTSLGLHMAFGF